METITNDKATNLAKEMYKLRKEKQALEVQVNEIDSKADQIKIELTNIMTDLGMQKFGLEGIGTFYLSTNIYPKIQDQDALILWLDEHQKGDIAPRKVHMPSLREMFETNLEKDLAVPPPALVDMSTEVSVRLRMTNKGV
jgi:hypothetical protein